MQALVLEDTMQLALREVSEPAIADDEVRIRVAACGICGSDVHGMDGSTGRRRPPIIMGHEAAGTIVAVGDAVSGWESGDRVTFDSTVYCGICAYCRAGRINLCDQRRVLGVSCAEYHRDGAFAEFVSVPARILYRLPDGLDFAQAAMVEPVSIAFHAANRTPMRIGDSAIVFGAGMIGLLLIQTLRLAGYGTIFAVDLDEAKLAMAEDFGADHGLSAEDPALVEKILMMTDGGVDHAFEAVGIGETVATAFETVRKGGSITLVGNLQPKIDFPLQAAVTREIALYGSCASSGEYPACLEMIASGQIDLTPLITAVAPLSEGAAWFKRLHDKEPGLMKVILTPEENGNADDA